MPQLLSCLIIECLISYLMFFKQLIVIILYFEKLYYRSGFPQKFKNTIPWFFHEFP